MTSLKWLFPLALLFVLACESKESSADSTTQEIVTPADGPAYTDLSVAQFTEKMKEENVVILDVRTPGETARGIIDGAIEIDYRQPDFADKIKALDKNKTYLVYCQSGGRSARAAELLAEQGFPSLYNLADGYRAWPAE